MKKAYRILVLTTLMSISVSHLEAAQNRPSERRMRFPQQRERMEREIQARFDQWIMDALTLDAKDAAEVRSIFAEFRADRRSLAERERRIKQLVSDCVRSERGRRWERVEMGMEEQIKCEDDSSEEVMQEMVDLMMEESRLFAEEMDTLTKTLTHKQVLLLLGMREEFKSHAERIRSGESRRRRGGRGSSGSN